MKGSYQIDKRIVLFGLFSLPVIVVAVISLIVNSQPIYTNSKADEMQKVQMVTPTPSLPKQITCLVPRPGTQNSIALHIEKGATFVPSLPLQIFAVQPASVQYLSLVEMIPSDSTTAVTTVRTNLIEKGGLIRFVAIQGDTAGFSETGSDLNVRIQSLARSCHSLVLE